MSNSSCIVGDIQLSHGKVPSIFLLDVLGSYIFSFLVVYVVGGRYFGLKVHGGTFPRRYLGMYMLAGV